MAADTYTALLGAILMGTGNDNNSWGDNANTLAFQIFEDAIAGALSSAVTGGTLDLSGTPPPAAASQARYAALIFTGTLASNQIVQVPNLKKFWWVKNSTSGAYTLTIKTPSGSASTAIPQNSGWQLVYCDGSDAIVVSPFNTKQIQMPDGTVALPAYSNATEPSSGWYRAGTQDWRLSINGVDVLQVTGTGASTPSIFNVLSPNALQKAGLSALIAGDTVPAADGSLAAPGLTFNSELYSGFYRTAAGSVSFGILQQNILTASPLGFVWKNSTFAGSDLSPTAISTDQNNYSPAGLGLIQTLGSITGGSSYTNGTYLDKPLTGGTGTGAKATIVVSGNAVTAVTMTKLGTGYVAGDTLSVVNSDVGGTGSGFSVPVSAVDAMTGSCLRLNVTAAANMTGLAGGSASREIELINIGTDQLTCPANSGSSTAANRFATAFSLMAGESVVLRYDATSSLWRLKSPASLPLTPPAIGIKNLSIKVASNTTVTYSEDVCIVSDGVRQQALAFSGTINLATTGVDALDTGTIAIDTPYAIWFIAKSDGTTKAIASASFSAPTMPTGYTFKAYRGSVRTIHASATLYGTWQRGRDVAYIVGLAQTAALPIVVTSGVAGSATTPTWIAASVSAFVPSSATSIKLMLNQQSGSAAAVAPNNSYGGYGSLTNPPPVGTGLTMNMPFEFELESSNIYYGFNGGSTTIVCRGWQENI